MVKCCLLSAPVAQRIERCPPEAEVRGSNPLGRAILSLFDGRTITLFDAKKFPNALQFLPVVK